MRSVVHSVPRRRSAARRGLASYGAARAQVLAGTSGQHGPCADKLLALGTPNIKTNPRSIRLGAVRVHNKLAKAYFDSTRLVRMGDGGKDPKEPNKANLGKTLRILQERLPTLLQSPLPQSILAPNISLHLFPSTHPHLPTVSGRVAYNAALWSAPIAWNRVPIIGNVRLEILAERMTSEPLTFLPRRPGAIPEQLVVRWTDKCGGDRKHPVGKEEKSILQSLGLHKGVHSKKAFTGLFIFDFDREGRILSHTIETAQQDGNHERGMGAKFVGLTDWLLGGIKDPGEAAPAFDSMPRRRCHD